MTERGEVWVADLEPVLYNEQGGIRPVIVMSNSELNSWQTRLAVIVPVTSRERRLRHHVRVAGGGLDRPSFAMPEYVRSISQRRFKRRLGVAEPATIDLVGRWLDWIVRA